MVGTPQRVPGGERGDSVLDGARDGSAKCVLVFGDLTKRIRREDSEDLDQLVSPPLGRLTAAISATSAFVDLSAT